MEMLNFDSNLLLVFRLHLQQIGLLLDCALNTLWLTFERSYLRQAAHTVVNVNLLISRASVRNPLQRPLIMLKMVLFKTSLA